MRINRKFWLGLFSDFLRRPGWQAGPRASQQQQAKPNIVLIVSDDFGYGDSGPTAAALAAACPRPASTGWRMKA